MSKRVGEYDFLKCVFILLMVAFHLVYISEKYPYAKELVYTFHVPAFLFLSGFLMNVDKKVLDFLRSMFWIFVPYVIMECGYVGMSAVLPVRERIDHLTFQVLVEKVLLHPMGPYWYLHTLLVSGVAYFGVWQLMRISKTLFPKLVVLSLVFAGLSYKVELLSPSSALYFVLGVSLKQTGVPFTSFFRASGWALIPFVLLAAYPVNFDRYTLPGLLITYLAICLVLAVYQLLPRFIQCFGEGIGRHSLLLLLFSPLFTMAVKPLVPVLSFDVTGMLFLVTSLCVTVIGCLGIGWGMDKLGMSRFFFGREKVLSPAE